LLQDKVIRFK